MISKMLDCASWSRSTITGSTTFSGAAHEDSGCDDGLMMRRSFRMILLSLLPSKQKVCSPTNPRSVAIAICSCCIDSSVHCTSSSVYLIFSTGSMSWSLLAFTNRLTFVSIPFMISEEMRRPAFRFSSWSRRITELVGFTSSVYRTTFRKR